MQVNNIARRAIILSPESSVLDAVHRMIEEDLGSVIVAGGESSPGLFAMRDLARKVVAGGLDPEATRLGDVMTPEVVWAMKEATLKQAIEFMEEHHIHHLPMLEEWGFGAGMLTLQDLLKRRVDNLENEVESLKAWLGADGIGGG